MVQATSVHWRYAESLAEVSKSGTGYTDILTLEEDLLSSVAGFVFWSAAMGGGSTTQDGRIRYQMGGVDQNSVNVEQSDTTDYQIWNGGTYLNPGSPGRSHNLQYSSESSNTVTAKNMRLIELQLGTNNKFAENLTEQTTTSTTPVDMLTLTFTPPGTREYYLIFMCELSSTQVSGAHVYVDIEGVSYGPYEYGMKDVTNWRTFTFMFRVSWTATSKTAKIQLRRDPDVSQTASIRNARIIAIHTIDFKAAYDAYNSSGTTTTDTTYFNLLTLTQTLTAGPHLVMGGLIFLSNSTSVSSYWQLAENGTQMCEHFHEGFTPTSGKTPDYGLMAAYVKDFEAGSYNFTIDIKQETATSSAQGKEINIFVLQLHDARSFPGVAPFLRHTAPLLAR